MPGILIVGEAPGEEEIKRGTPFVGPSGQELDRMLAEAGIIRSECSVTNVVHERLPGNDIDQWFYTKTEAKKLGIPEYLGRYPDPRIIRGISSLSSLIAERRPTLILALGNTALWALTGKTGITRWRGSILRSNRGPKLIPVVHPAMVLRNWSYRSTAVRDFERAKYESGFADIRYPAWRFRIAPDRDTVDETLASLEWMADYSLRGDTPLHLSVDIETKQGQISCVGVAWSTLDALCIPIRDITKPQCSYWPHADEVAIVARLRRLLHHPGVRVSGQNYSYDSQYLGTHWFIHPRRVWLDTMLAHHLCFPDLPKGLNFLSSMYCSFHEYWKDEGKEYDENLHDPIQHWTYNCRDCVATFEVAEVLAGLIPREVTGPDLYDDTRRTIIKPNLSAQFAEQMEIFQACYEITMRGVRVDGKRKAEILIELADYLSHYEAYFQRVITRSTHDPGKRKAWYRSPQQCAEIFYEHLKIQPVMDRKTKRPTTQGEALRIIGKREPLVRPITDTLMQYRSIETIGEAVARTADPDGRIRSSYNPAGTITFRLSSSTNAFGGGTNLQNITTGEKYGGEDWRYFPVPVEFPNLRRYFIPDPGHIIYDIDLARADAQVVAAEANDSELLDVFESGADVHTANAIAIFGEKLGSQKEYRQLAKGGVHGTNYGASAYTISRALNISVSAAEAFQASWFASHPGIKEWHQRIERELHLTKSVRNKFGYYIRFEDRADGLLPEALAWIPQSTVGILINKIWLRMRESLPWVKVLMQVHDSLVVQVPREMHSQRWKIRELAQIPIPYPRPLTIAVGIKCSDANWGDVKAIDWN